MDEDWMDEDWDASPLLILPTADDLRNGCGGVLVAGSPTVLRNHIDGIGAGLDATGTVAALASDWRTKPCANHMHQKCTEPPQRAFSCLLQTICLLAHTAKRAHTIHKKQTALSEDKDFITLNCFNTHVC